MGRKVQFDVLALAKAQGFEASSAKIDRLAQSADKSAKSFERQRRETKLLSTSLLAIGSAAIPVAAVSTGLGGLAVAGGVALLAVKGIEKEIKAGTPTGNAYAASIATIKTNVSGLERAAAGGVLGGFQKSVKQLQPLMPALTRDTALYAHQLGDIGGNTGVGFVRLLRDFHPLFAQVGADLEGGSAKFAQWSKSSQGVQRFVAYAQTQLPQVESTFGALFTTVSHVTQGLEPFGSTTLLAIRVFSQAINSIPVGVLQTLLPILAGLKVGNTLSASINNASVGLTGFAKKATTAGGLASKSAGFVGGLGKAVGFLGPAGLAAGVALGGLSVVLGRSKKATVEQTSRINELVAAIENGTAAAGAWNNALETGAADATKTGLSQKQITAALIGTQAAYAGAQKHLDQYKQVQDNAALSGGQFGATAQQVAARQQEVAAQTDKLKASLAESRREYEAAKQRVADYATQQGSSALAAQITNDSYLKIAKSLGVTGDAYIKAKLAADSSTESQRQATLVMQLEGDTAGLLKQALDGLAGKALSVGEAQTRLAQSATAAAQALKTNGNTVALNTAKGQANRAAIEAMAEASRGLVDAQLKNVKSSTSANAVIDKANEKFKTNAARIYGAKSKAYEYAVQVGLIPHVAATDVRFNDSKARAKARALKAWVESLHPVMEVTAHTSITSGHGKLAQRAGGGGAPNGWFTVGERGYELAYKSGSQVQFFSHQQSQAMTGMARVPGYAAGTGAGIRLSVETKGLPALVAAVKGTTSALNTALRSLMSQLLRGNKAGLAPASFVRTISRENTQLLGEARKRDLVAARIKSANQRLVAAQTALTQERATVTQASLSFFNLGSADTSSTAGFLADLTNRAHYTKQFATDLKSLTHRLPKALIRQLGEEGVDQAGTATHLLASMSAAELKRVGSLYATAAAASGSVGSAVARSLYGAGVNAAKGLIAGLRSQERSLAAVMRHLASIMVGQIRHELGIHSRSKVGYELGAYFGMGMENGISSRYQKVRTASAGLADAAVPSMGGGTGRSVTNYNEFNITTSDPNVAAERAAARLSWTSQTP